MYHDQHIPPCGQQAAQRGHVSTVRLLHARGARADTRNRQLWTIAHVAAYCGRLEDLRHFLAMGVGHGAADKAGRTCLHWAVLRGHAHIVQVITGLQRLCNGCTGRPPLGSVRRRGLPRREVQSSLYGPEVSSDRFSAWLTPSSGWLQELLSRGAGVDVGDRAGTTSLHLADIRFVGLLFES
jgi:ankyrin repeat protein